MGECMSVVVTCYVVSDECNELTSGLQTQPTSDGAVIADTSCCATCVEPSRPQQWGPDLPF